MNRKNQNKIRNDLKDKYDNLLTRLPPYYNLSMISYKHKALSIPNLVYLIQIFNMSKIESSESYDKRVSSETLCGILRDQLKFTESQEEIEEMLKRKNYNVKEINFFHFIYIVDMLKREKHFLKLISQTISYSFIILAVFLLIYYLSLFYNL